MTALFERIPKEKQNRILEAATAEFSSHGYDSANTNIIAQKADISVGSLFKYFESKEDLFLATVRHAAAVLKDALENILEGEEDVLIKVEKVLRTIQRHSRKSISMIRLYNELSAHSNSKFTVQVADELESVTATLYASLVEKAQSENEARLDCDPKMFAFLLDNIFVMLQFSYACDYYRERFKIYVGEDIFEKDDFVVEQTLKFIKAAFTNKSK